MQPPIARNAADSFPAATLLDALHDIMLARRNRNAMAIRLLSIAVLVMIRVGFANSAWGADRVVVIRDGQPRTLSGEILDYTGSELKLKTAAGREETIPGSQVKSVETQWSDEQMSADKKRESGDFQAALDEYRQAQTAEKRLWVKRRIAAWTVVCHRQLGDWRRATELFSTLHRNDPTTPYFDCIPLSWTPMEPDSNLNRWATGLLQEEKPAIETLIACSLLISLGDRSVAVAALEQLTLGKTTQEKRARDKSSDERISQLAEAQLWRPRVVKANSADLELWRAAIERMPTNIRPGPWFVLGQGLSRQERRSESALAFLRGPIAQMPDRLLAAESFLAAGKELERMGRVEETATLYREIVADYPFSSAAREASQWLAKPAAASAKSTQGK